jgi:hypothetical protein
MTEWKVYPDSNIEVSSDGRARRNGIEFLPSVDSYGYKKVSIGGRKGTNIRLHRLIAICFIPNPENKPHIDHIDGNRLNNMVSNLRWATRHENRHNTIPSSRELPRGVSILNKKFRARIAHEHLGTYDTPEEASEAYEAAAKELFGEFYRPA